MIGWYAAAVLYALGAAEVYFARRDLDASIAAKTIAIIFWPVAILVCTVLEIVVGD